jgi:hypothetical protein
VTATGGFSTVGSFSVGPPGGKMVRRERNMSSSVCGASELD